MFVAATGGHHSSCRVYDSDIIREVIERNWTGEHGHTFREHNAVPTDAQVGQRLKPVPLPPDAALWDLLLCSVQ